MTIKNDTHRLSKSLTIGSTSMVMVKMRIITSSGSECYCEFAKFQSPETLSLQWIICTHVFVIFVTSNPIRWYIFRKVGLDRSTTRIHVISVFGREIVKCNCGPRFSTSCVTGLRKGWGGSELCNCSASQEYLRCL
jgi:hypothetical protein